MLQPGEEGMFPLMTHTADGAAARSPAGRPHEVYSTPIRRFVLVGGPRSPDYEFCRATSPKHR